MYELYRQHLSVLHDTGKYRRLSNIRQDNNYIDFSKNDYLCLSKNADIIESAVSALKEYGVGATGSRLLSGNNPLFEEFEAVIAQSKHTEASLIFTSGFQANFNTLSTLLSEEVLGEKPLVFFDKCNHASLYQAIFVSKPQLYRYSHNNIDQLEALLDAHKNDMRAKFIVTETVFGMDGDIVQLERIIELVKYYKAFLYLDEAHAIGILGGEGYGLSTNYDLKDVPYVVMGSFSKALGCSGGYVACSQVLRDYLINKAPGFIYSTAPSPGTIGAAYKAWNMIRDLKQERQKLKDLGEFLRINLKKLNLNIGNSNTHIVPIILGEEKLCLKVRDNLLKDKIIVSLIRPPTVAPNSWRLRIALNIDHEPHDIEKLIDSLKINEFYT